MPFQKKQIPWNKDKVFLSPERLAEKRKCFNCHKIYGYKRNTDNTWVINPKFCSLFCAGEVFKTLRIGKEPWNKDRTGIFSEETLLKMSEARKGKVYPGMFRKGHIFAQEIIEKVRLKKIGVKQTEEHKRKNSEANTGEKHWNWHGGITSEKKLIRHSREWKLWRAEVFERDRYTCMECKRSGVYLEAHHIVPIRSDRDRVFDIKNGITLCRPCHIKTMWKELNFAERYSALVEAH